MTPAMKQILCEGRNFEHTHSSVHGFKLQLLFQLYSTWKIAVDEYNSMFKAHVHQFACYSMILIFV